MTTGPGSSLPASASLLARGVAQLVRSVAVIMFGFASPGVARSDGADAVDVRPAFELHGEHGDVAFQGDVVTMFSSTAPPQTARLSQAKSRKAPAHLPLAAASRPGLCDARDQISLDPSLSSWLPPGAKVKHVVAADRDLVLAAYSLPSEGRSNELWVAVLMRADGGPTHRLVSAARVSGEGRESFCGLYVLGRTGFMVVLEEATGSSDYLVARGFTVDRPSAGR